MHTAGLRKFTAAFLLSQKNIGNVLFRLKIASYEIDG